MYEELTIQKAIELLKKAAPAGSKVILFGSYARGDAREHSDLDFMVVEPQVESRLDETNRLHNAIRPLKIAADVLVISQKTFDHWKDTPTTVMYQAAHLGREY